MKTLFGSALPAGPGAPKGEWGGMILNRLENNYQGRRCGDNILGLVKAARDQWIALEGARILMIENMG